MADDVAGIIRSAVPRLSWNGALAPPVTVADTAPAAGSPKLRCRSPLMVPAQASNGSSTRAPALAAVAAERISTAASRENTTLVSCLYCSLPVVSRTTGSKLEFGKFDQ